METRFLHPNGLDASSVLTGYVVLLLAIPSAMAVSALGSAGAPSAIMAVATLLWWMWFHVQRDKAQSTQFQPVRAAMIAWLVIMFADYVHAMSAPLPGDEISPADSGLLKLVGMAGVLFVANDGIPSLGRHRVVVQRLVAGVGIIAVLGLFQYATGELWIDRIRIPGLTAGSADLALAQRSGLVRPSGTSTHPIEYGVVLTMVLPLIVVFAMRSPTRRWLYRVTLCAVALAVVLSISRSALLCALVGVIVLAAGWSAVARLWALLFTTILAVVVYVVSPGVLGTLGSLFAGASDDPSINSRTGSFELAAQFIGNSPVFGRGFGTFLPKYWILDNGYLGLLIEGGVLGFVGLLLLIGIAVFAAGRARTLAIDPFDREIAHALIASIAAGACGLAFFDTFAFPQSAGCFFLLLGLSGASYRLNQVVRKPSASPVSAERTTRTVDRARGRSMRRRIQARQLT